MGYGDGDLTGPVSVLHVPKLRTARRADVHSTTSTDKRRVSSKDDRGGLPGGVRSCLRRGAGRERGRGVRRLLVLFVRSFFDAAGGLSGDDHGSARGGRQGVLLVTHSICS